jgi:hypothetical protein
MALQQRGDYWYGDSASDIRVLLSMDRPGSDPITVFADAVCECGGRVFTLQLDDEYQEAALFCKACDSQHLFHTTNVDGYYEGHPEADTEWCGCPCTKRGATYYEITLGASLYDGSDDVRWVHIGCRCVACGLVAFYASWHRIEIPYQTLFARLRNKMPA